MGQDQSVRTASVLALRRVDENRFLSVAFAPARARRRLLAFYAFHHEIARIAETVEQPLAGLIRLQWWREALHDLYAGRIRGHPALHGLAEALSARPLPRAMLDSLVTAREPDFEECPFADTAALAAYADATSGQVMRIALRLLDAGAAFDAPASEAGLAYGLTGLLRAAPFWAARRRLLLPADALACAGVEVESVYAGAGGPGLRAVVDSLVQAAAAHHAAARQKLPRRFLPALLPAAVAPLHLARMKRPGFDPSREVSDVARVRRQGAMMAAYARARL